MSRIAIDFARRPVFRAHPLAWLAMMAGAGLGVAAWLVISSLQQNTATQDATARRLQARLHARTEQQQVLPHSTITEVQAAAVNGAIAQLNLPWRDLFDAMEAATPKSIALLELQPDARRNVVKGVAEAKSSDDMIAYVEQLKKQELFTAVVLTHHEVNEQDPNKPLRFRFEAQWAGALP